ncbi:pyocin activator PrtN family protein [Rhizobium sp. BK418]|uniref:pyocin activator PrtN family protein n=1 Tax=Rhizobium sp. BK418 TaxID=2512120 RepID=UPI0010515BBE|nr:pyocin activator PrtN family protein [Rhizobium sp. BK418]TCR98611.1 pyocin activator protein PrtN [Rhizobium sp. BK418]
MSTMTEMKLSTSFLLFAQYGGRAVIPVEHICRDYFNHLTPVKFLRKVGSGEIAIPVVRAETSRALGVHCRPVKDKEAPADRKGLELYTGLDALNV